MEDLGAQTWLQSATIWHGCGRHFTGLDVQPLINLHIDLLVTTSRENSGLKHTRLVGQVGRRHVNGIWWQKQGIFSHSAW